MTRLLSGVVLAAGAVAAILWLPLAGLCVLACLVAALAAREYLPIVGEDGNAASATPTLVLVVLACLMAGTAMRTALPLLVMIAFAWLAVEVMAGRTMAQAAVRFAAPWYIGLPLGTLVAVHDTAGRWATLLLMGTVVVSDSSQYYSGRLFGRRPLAATISPKKTIEGAIGGVIGGTAFMVLAGAHVFVAASPVALLLLGAALVALGICGDLFQSRLKRFAGVKDSAAVIPGHGGVLDRIDALLFAAPAFYLWVDGYRVWLHPIVQ